MRTEITTSFPTSTRYYRFIQVRYAGRFAIPVFG